MRLEIPPHEASHGIWMNALGLLVGDKDAPRLGVFHKIDIKVK
jgi:hypothetical protein